MRLGERWQDILAGHALAARRGSKDPSTKVGAVIYRPDMRIASTGFNGLPSAIPDDPERMLDRDWKLQRTIHAEVNAIDSCVENVKGYGVVVTAHPCAACTLRLINKGIATIYFLDTGLESTERWAGDMLVAAKLCREANVPLIMLDKNKGRD
jgi:dCMP deaminase